MCNSNGVNAAELNRTLQGTVAERLLSHYGRRLFFPKGIVAQSAEAAAAGVRYNATQGIASDGQAPLMLPSLQRHYGDQSSSDIVAYAPTGGLPELRSLWLSELRHKNPSLQGTISTPLVTPGITSGIGIAADLFVDPHDTIIMPEPMWGNYRLIFSIKREATLRTYPFFSADGGFNIQGLAQQIEQAAGAKKLIVHLNFPHNPIGYAISNREAEKLLALLAQVATHTPLVVILDDAYFGLWYDDDCYRQSLFAPLASQHENLLAVKVDGATKEEYAWGLRVGFLTFGSAGLEPAHCAALEQKCLGALRAAFSNSNRWAQHTLCLSLRSATHATEKERIFKQLTERYYTLQEYLKQHSANQALIPLPFNGGYFVCFRCTNCHPEELRQKLLAQGIGIIAIDESHIRVTYSTIPTNHITGVFDSIFRHA